MLNKYEELIKSAENWLNMPIAHDINQSLGDSRVILDNLQKAIQDDGASKKEIGSLIGRIKGTQNALKSIEKVNWVKIGNGYLAIGHRPSAKLVSDLRLQNATHILTLLSEKEGADKIEILTKKNDLAWLWFPMESAEPPVESKYEDLAKLFVSLKQALADEKRIYLHCSAGIHRTGMIGFAFLRFIGKSTDDANKVLKALRVETSEGVGEKRMAWGDSVHKLLH